MKLISLPEDLRVRINTGSLCYFEFMDILISFISGWRDSFDYKGVTSRKNFWYFVLAEVMLFILVLGLFTGSLAISEKDNIFATSLLIIGFIYWIARFFPRISLGVRRLRDMGRSGYWILLDLIPLGPLINLYWVIKPSLRGSDGQVINHIQFNEIIDSFSISWKRAFDFKGISKRKEFWSFLLISTLIYFCLFFLGFIPIVLSNIVGHPSLIKFSGFVNKGFSALSSLYILGALIAYLSLSIRRLRDINKSLYWIFLLIIPYLNLIPMLLLFTKESDQKS